jgi:hypothetical protein
VSDQYYEQPISTTKRLAKPLFSSSPKLSEIALKAFRGTVVAFDVSAAWINWMGAPSGFFATEPTTDKASPNTTTEHINNNNNNNDKELESTTTVANTNDDTTPKEEQSDVEIAKAWPDDFILLSELLIVEPRLSPSRFMVNYNYFCESFRIVSNERAL